MTLGSCPPPSDVRPCLQLPMEAPSSSSSPPQQQTSPRSPSSSLLLRTSAGGQHRSRRSSVQGLVAGHRLYSSPHHSRSQSVRSARRPNRLELPEFRSRVSSMPLEASRYNPRLVDDDEFYRLRSFSITAKGVVNRGDSLRSRRSKSNTSVDSSCGGQRGDLSAATSRASSRSGGGAPSAASSALRYRVAILGAADVGKTALTSQFLTSEYMNAYDASLDDDFGEKTVSVLLDGEESEMVFIDHPSSEMSVENFVSTYEPHAYVVVYSIIDHGSYAQAEDILAYLWKGDYTRNKGIILVGNKTDLVRARVISTDEGKSLATSHDCKFIETSSGINHNVDELLVGILSQIRLKLQRATSGSGSGNGSDGQQQQQQQQQRDAGRMTTEDRGKKKKKKQYKGGSRTVSFRAKGLLNKFCKNDKKSKSCENLHVL